MSDWARVRQATWRLAIVFILRFAWYACVAMFVMACLYCATWAITRGYLDGAR